MYPEFGTLRIFQHLTNCAFQKKKRYFYQNPYPDINVTVTLGPENVTVTLGPEIVTVTLGPEIVTVTLGPEIACVRIVSGKDLCCLQ